MELDYLCEHPEFIPTLAQWHHDEWGHLRPGDTVEKRAERIHNNALGRAGIPTAVIAFEGDKLLGSAMLIASDMTTHPHLTPWLAGVFVAPEGRKHGVGGALVRRIMADAKSIGVKRLYLYTEHAEHFYSHLGWSTIERANYRGVDVAIMAMDFK